MSRFTVKEFINFKHFKSVTRSEGTMSLCVSSDFDDGNILYVRSIHSFITCYLNHLYI